MAEKWSGWTAQRQGKTGGVDLAQKVTLLQTDANKTAAAAKVITTFGIMVASAPCILVAPDTELTYYASV